MNGKLGIVIGFVLALGLGAAYVWTGRAPAGKPQEAAKPPAPKALDAGLKASGAGLKAVPATFDPAMRAPEQPAAGPSRQDGHVRIAVVRLSECFDEKKYDKIKDIRAQFESMIKELDEQAKTYETDVKAKADVIKLSPPGSKARQDAVKKFELARAQLQIHKSAAKEIALNGYAKFQAEAYQEILRVVALVGSEGGYELILKYDDVKFEDESQPTDVSQQIAIKNVLWANPTSGIDITDRVIQRLNQEYKKP